MKEKFSEIKDYSKYYISNYGYMATCSMNKTYL
jgi:hypothetical protein